MTAYNLRIAIFSLLLALITALVVWYGPTINAITVITQAPTGEEVSVGAPIRIIFSEPVDRRSVEERFTITPTAPGSFFWEGQRLTFQPSQPLRPDTTYRVTLQPGVADQAARATTAEPIEWSFRTRSPRLLLLRHTSDDTSTLLLANPAGNEPRELLNMPARIESITSASDGSQALISVRRDADRTALLLVDLADGATQPLTDRPDASASAPAWSPNGTLIAYEQRTLQAGTTGDPAIWLSQPDGTSLGPITEAGQSGTTPVWSPDSRRLAFYDPAAENITIYDFTSTFQTLPNSDGQSITWAADSSALIYTSSQAGRLQYVELATDIARDLAIESAGIVTGATWSPDGQWIAFAQRSTPTAVSTLWQMRPDGSDQQLLTNPGPVSDSEPVWSPDSQQLAFLRTNSEGENAAWLLELTSGEARQIITDVVQVIWVP